ncbi:hypothetical protein K2X96_00785 [Patescibacteria group bacterium]|nr:hypothetical protein [Patescibacteria group bacterium]
MEYIFMIVPVVYKLALTLGIGSSTFALIFFIQSKQDGIVDETERRFLRTVITVMRVGMVGIVASLLFYTYAFWNSAVNLFADPIFLMESTIMTVIILNAILMQFRVMPMWLGPAIAGASWYSLFFLTSVPFTVTSYGMFITYYALFGAVFYGVFTIIQHFFSPKPKVI